jgi:hypothetical protein
MMLLVAGKIQMTGSDIYILERILKKAVIASVITVTHACVVGNCKIKGNVFLVLN